MGQITQVRSERQARVNHFGGGAMETGCESGACGMAIGVNATP
jgi:hypothetical protein